MACVEHHGDVLGFVEFVAEFLGAQRGIGVTIVQAQAVTDVAGVFAALIILGALGILLHLIIRARLTVRSAGAAIGTRDEPTA